MSEVTTVSMSEEQKRYAEKHGISLSKLVQDEIDKRRKQTGDRRTQLKKEISEVKSDLEELREYEAQKEAELEQLQAELEDLEGAEDELVMEMVGILEAKITGDAKYQLQNSPISAEEANDCFDACVGRTGTETTEEVEEMLVAEGYTKDHLNPAKRYNDDSEVDEKSHNMALDLVKNNLTPEEKERVEEWVQSNL